MFNLLPILFCAFFVFAFGFVLIYATSKFGPKTKQSKMKTMPYECGLEGQSTGKSQISVKFYLTAILFILFDIEIIFMYPWAVSYLDFLKEGYGLYIFIGMGVFLALFIYGLFWEIKSRALEWD